MLWILPFWVLLILGTHLWTMEKVFWGAIINLTRSSSSQDCLSLWAYAPLFLGHPCSSHNLFPRLWPGQGISQHSRQGASAQATTY